MTDTVLSSASKEVAIGFGRPFVMIGERINPTGRNLLAEEMKNGDFSRVESDAIAQVKAGAQMLDVNAGIPLADEPALLAQAIRLVRAFTMYFHLANVAEQVHRIEDLNIGGTRA
ncbi:hypothetical protein, partial [Aeromicrobium sp. REDSEA-S38_B2]|uniref:hypothetical protein n=1 Tax=Aeromicrobium sp. REDSEA-S38_B2 TaxID=1811528 RepID=UPI000A7D5D4C